MNNQIKHCEQCNGAILKGVNGYGGIVCRCQYPTVKVNDTNIYTDNSATIANMQKTIDEQKALIHELTDLLDKAKYCVVIASDYRYDIAGSDDEKCQEYNQLNVRIYNKLQALAPPSEKG